MDPLQQLLLAQLSGDQTADLAPTLTDVLSTSVGDDPFGAAVVEALRRREQRQSPTEPDDLETLVVESEPEDLEGMDPVAADVLQRLYDEVETLRSRTLLLAEALGACPRCWGEDRRCPICRGRGSPGGRVPDETLFLDLVEPAVRRDAARRHALPAPEPVPGARTSPTH